MDNLVAKVETPHLQFDYLKSASAISNDSLFTIVFRASHQSEILDSIVLWLGKVLGRSDLASSCLMDHQKYVGLPRND